MPILRSYCWRRVARRKLKRSTHTGGGAVNAAVAMARLGMDVMILAKIGNDERGEIILQRLEQEGVSTSLVKRDLNAPTGTSVLISSHDRDAAIFTFRGANTLLKPEDLQDEAFDADLIYVANLSNKSADCFPLIVDRAKKHNALRGRKSRSATAFRSRRNVLKSRASRYSNTEPH